MDSIPGEAKFNRLDFSTSSNYARFMQFSCITASGVTIYGRVQDENNQVSACLYDNEIVDFPPEISVPAGPMFIYCRSNQSSDTKSK